jgi:dihydrofolate synthase / folylpolyglutamate synthase
VDIAVVETGLGGRLDSTNVITPEVTAITSISKDHMAQLGPRWPIATEKAGIFKHGVPAVSVAGPAAEAVLKKGRRKSRRSAGHHGKTIEFSYPLRVQPDARPAQSRLPDARPTANSSTWPFP